jgi:hypothetical protein
MKLGFEKGFRALMYLFELELLLHEKLGKDLGGLLMSFLKEDPKPFAWEWVVERPPSSPWDLPVEVDSCDGVALPLFAP